MKTNEIIEGNKLIAEFMGWKIQKRVKPNCKNPDTLKWECDPAFLYDSSWNWLMPVVEKIDSMGFDVQISRISVKISRILENENPIISLVCGDISQKLYLCFIACVDFVKWYNQNK